jgi:DNA helicase-2/ATP-dependent DNA helicase PcrA
VSFERIVNTPARGIGKTTVERVLAHAERTKQTALEVIRNADQIPDVSRAVRHLTEFSKFMEGVAAVAARGNVQETIDYTVLHSGLVAMWSQAIDEDAQNNVNELITAAAEYDRHKAEGEGSLTDWLTQVSLVSDVDAIDPQVGAVTMMTLHAAKGLEFDSVFMAGLEEGLLPHQRSQVDRADVEEERRLCFVGMTRARKSLTMTSAKWREVRGVTQRNSRSRFLAELPREGIRCLSIGEEGSAESEHDHNMEEAPPRSSRNWQRGQYVRHAQYGIGRILWIEPRNHRTHAGVAFAAYGQKTFILEVAPIEIVEPDELD